MQNTSRTFTYLSMLACASLLMACTPKTPSSTDTAEPAAPIATAETETPKHVHSDWEGRWDGVEGTFLDVTPLDLGTYTLTMQSDLDTFGTYEGKDTEEGISFSRKDKTFLLRAGNGDETNLKWLAGKKDCLVVMSGEGYCRSSSTADTTEVMPPMVQAGPTVFDLTLASDDLSVLAMTIKAAGLDGVLNGSGPFTVFAPTNEVFGYQDIGMVDTLIMPENKDKLTSILAYHIVAGEVTAADLIKAIEDSGKSYYTFQTINGGILTATMAKDSVMLQDSADQFSKVFSPDIKASNGVVHLVDSVLMPE